MNEDNMLREKVKALFRLIEEGKFKIDKDRTPNLVEEINAVRFDDNGEPIIDTVGRSVRLAANLAFEREVERAEESPVKALLPERVDVSEPTLERCREAGDFTEVAFCLTKETALVVMACASVYTSTDSEEGFPREQAICVGLLVRLTKLFLGVMQLTQQGTMGEVGLVLIRSILETCVNLLYLLRKGTSETYDQFVVGGLRAERELYDIIQGNVELRGGTYLPIETRMLRAINVACELSGVSVEELPSHPPRWGRSLLNKMTDLEMEEEYLSLQRYPSHAVHGTWSDLIRNHLGRKGTKYVADFETSEVDLKYLMRASLLALDAASQYVDDFIHDVPESHPLVDHISDLRDRVWTAFRDYFDWKDETTDLD